MIPNPEYALTLRPPWAYAVCVLGKDVENRGWPAPRSQLRPGDWLLIHGGKPPTARDELAEIADEVRGLHEEFGHLVAPRADVTLADVVMGHAGIVAACRFDGVCSRMAPSRSPWWEGRNYGWRLGRTVVLPEPIAVRGGQGLWRPPADVMAEVRRQLAGLEIAAWARRP